MEAALAWTPIVISVVSLAVAIWAKLREGIVTAKVAKFEAEEKRAIEELRQGFAEQQADLARLHDKATTDWSARAEIRVQLTLEDMRRVVKMNDAILLFHGLIAAVGYGPDVNESNEMLQRIRRVRATSAVLPVEVREPAREALKALSVLESTRWGVKDDALVFDTIEKTTEKVSLWADAVSVWRDQLTRAFAV